MQVRGLVAVDSELLSQIWLQAQLRGEIQSSWIKWKLPVPGAYTGSREPSYGVVPTGCEAPDYKLQNGLPVKSRVQLVYANTAFWESLTSRDQNEYEKRHHDLARQCQDDTRKNPGNAILGSLDAEGIYATLRDHFQAEPKRRFCGNGISENSFDFLTFIKHIQASLLRDPRG